jgi:hypothetical protein
MQEVVKLTKKNLIADMESGLTRSKMGEKYGLSTGMINRAMKQMGIEDMRAKVVKFVIVEDEEDIIPPTIDTLFVDVVEEPLTSMEITN